MSVGRIVQVDHPGLSGSEDLEKICDEIRVDALTDFRAGKTELDHRGVVSQPGGLTLLLLSETDQFCVWGLRVGSRAWRPGTVRDYHSGKSLGGMMQAGGDTRESENFQIIGMGPDSQVCGGGQGPLGIFFLRQKKISSGLREFHRDGFSPNTQKEAKT